MSRTRRPLAALAMVALISALVGLFEFERTCRDRHRQQHALRDQHRQHRHHVMSRR